MKNWPMQFLIVVKIDNFLEKKRKVKDGKN